MSLSCIQIIEKKRGSKWVIGIGYYSLIRRSVPTYDFKLRSACPSNRCPSFEQRISYLSTSFGAAALTSQSVHCVRKVGYTYCLQNTVCFLFFRPLASSRNSLSAPFPSTRATTHPHIFGVVLSAHQPNQQSLPRYILPSFLACRTTFQAFERS